MKKGEEFPLGRFAITGCLLAAYFLFVKLATQYGVLPPTLPLIVVFIPAIVIAFVMSIKKPRGRRRDMEGKKIWLVAILVAVGIGLVIPALAEASIYRWSRLGAAPLMPSVDDKLTLQERFPVHKSDVVEGLRLAEPSWEAHRVADLIESAIRADRGVEETSLPLGSRFQWMVFKSRSGVTVVRNVEWAGEKELQGFLISVPYGGKEFRFFLAKVCGNLTLLETRPLPAPSPKAEIVPPASPPVSLAPPAVPPAPPSEKVVERVIERVIEVPVVQERVVVEERPVYIQPAPDYDYEYMPRIPRRYRYIPFVPGPAYDYSAYDYRSPVTLNFDFHWSKVRVDHRYVSGERHRYVSRRPYHPPSPPPTPRRDRYCPPGSPGRR